MIESITYNPPLEVIRRRLQNLSERLGDKALNAGLTAAAKPLKAMMKTLVPKGKTGALARSIGQRQLSKTARGRIGLGQYARAILVGPTRKVAPSLVGPTMAGGPSTAGKKVYQVNGAFKAVWTEYGTEPHPIPKGLTRSGKVRKRKPKILRFYWHGKLVHFKSVSHPGFSGRYWMAKSLALTEGQMPALFMAGMARYLDSHEGSTSQSTE